MKVKLLFAKFKNKWAKLCDFVFLLGLCGNFNSIQADDFITVSGSPEATAVDFANGWKARANCPDVKNNFEDPCSFSLDNGMSRFTILHWR